MPWLSQWRRVCAPLAAAAVSLLCVERWRRPLLLAADAMPSARFPDPQEGEWHRKFTGDQAGLDAAVSLQTLLFPSLVARLLWDQARGGEAGDGLSAVDALWLAGFLAWAPLMLWLALRRPKAYLRLRTPIVLFSRLHRSLTFVRWAGLFSREAMGAGGPGGVASRQAQLGLLLWRPTSLVSLLFTYIVPFRYSAPCALLTAGVALHGAAQQCSSFCRATGMERAAVQLAPELVELLRGWQRLLSGLAPAAGAAPAGGVCAAAEGPVLASAAACSWDSCRNSCIAVNAWALLVLGTLAPLAVLWAVEERSRLRFQQQWLQIHGPRQAASPMAGGGGSRAQGLPWLVLLVWLLLCAWAVWAALDVLILR